MSHDTPNVLTPVTPSDDRAATDAPSPLAPLSAAVAQTLADTASQHGTPEHSGSVSSTQELASADVPTTPADSDPDDVDSVYHDLVRGVGREHVTDANVEALIERADADHHPMLAAELREWRSACGEEAVEQQETTAA